MLTLIEKLQLKFKEAALKAFPALSTDLSIEITPSTQEKFGHYQFNSAMKLGKTLQLSPRQIAEKITQALDPAPLISKTEIAGPGFVNITLATPFLEAALLQIVHDPNLGVERIGEGKKVVIDFSSPNTAKEMHVGHLRSTIIGDCLARVFEFLGYDVLRLNHIGDWGTAFGMLIAHIKLKAPKVISGQQETDLSHLVNWYKEAKQHFDNDPEFKRASQLQVVALQSGDPDALSAWKIICAISRKAYQEIYDLLDVSLQERGESFYNPMLADTVADLEARGIVEVSGGAKCVFLEGFQNREGEPLPLMVQKSDGGYNYDTTDMAAIRHRIEVEKADCLIYVTDSGQAMHFAMVFKAAEKAGYLDPKRVRVNHVPFGLVLGSDGKKFRTRSGDTEKLMDLLTTAVDQAETILIERNPSMEERERKELAKVLGISAIKYADLSTNRIGDYTFSYSRMLRFEGNTAAFLTYSYVRVSGIKRKIKGNVEEILSTATFSLSHPSEVALGVHINQFGEAIQFVAEELLPNRLTDYLYNLAEKFNAFYRDCPVEGAPEQNSRLLLCEATARVMRQGLELLGLKTVERM